MSGPVLPGLWSGSASPLLVPLETGPSQTGREGGRERKCFRGTWFCLLLRGRLSGFRDGLKYNVVGLASSDTCHTKGTSAPTPLLGLTAFSVSGVGVQSLHPEILVKVGNRSGKR